MTDNSARFALPLLQPGQAQKEMFHNEALAAIDVALHAAVEAIGMNAPPASPAIGQCWIVGDTPGGAWAGAAARIAAWTSGGWIFVAPVAGMTAWVAALARWVRHDGTAWRDEGWPCAGVAVGGVRVVGARQAAIAAPGGGTVVDAEARASIAAILDALRNHGLVAT